MQDQKSLIRHLLSFSERGSEHFWLVFDYKASQYIRKGQRYTNVDILRLPIGYLNATIYRKTRKPEPEIRTSGSSHTRQNPQLDGYGSGFGPPRCSGSGLLTGLGLNETVLAVRTRTAGRLSGTVANTSLEWTKQVLITLEEPMEVYMIEVIAASHGLKQQPISCRYSTCLLQWQGKEVRYSWNSQICAWP